MKTMSDSTKYGKPAIGCYLDQANYNSDDLSRKICEIAIGYGWNPSEEDRAIIGGCTDDEERSNGPDLDESEALYGLSEEATEWLNEQETRSFLYWANEGEANAFGLWPNVEGAKEDVGFVSSRRAEWPADDYEGEWLHVNDHGNATLYVREGGKDIEIWSVV